ncbi:MAG: aminotransferase, partial [Pseudomonadota bacterium]
RAFWNWQFVPDLPELPQTRAMLMRACDVRLPVHLPIDTLDAVADALLAAIDASVAVKAA